MCRCTKEQSKNDEYFCGFQIDMANCQVAQGYSCPKDYTKAPRAPSDDESCKKKWEQFVSETEFCKGGYLQKKYVY